MEKIAKNGHVMQYTANISNMNQNGGKLTLDKIGIKNASIFYGFCSKHDRELFSCIENEPFAGRPDQCLAIAYRTISRELYGKDAAAHLRETLRAADKGTSLANQFLFQQALDEINKGNQAARRELKATYENLANSIADERVDNLRSLVIQFENTLPFMFAGAWSPFTDIYDRDLQNGYLDTLLEQVFFSSFATKTGTQICISWLHVNNAPGEIIAE